MLFELKNLMNNFMVLLSHLCSFVIYEGGAFGESHEKGHCSIMNSYINTGNIGCRESRVSIEIMLQ